MQSRTSGCFPFPCLLGPMVGITHVAFRELVRSYLPVDFPMITFTEMLSTRRIPNERLESADCLRVAPGEKYLVMQLLAEDETNLVASIRKLEALDPFGFDINMGCTAQQIQRHLWGIRLGENPDLACRLIDAAKRATSKPVSAKIRLMEMGDRELSRVNTVVHFVEQLANAGADWITLHPRTPGQRHKGDADWNLAAEVASRVKIPVVINGDVQTVEDALHLMRDFSFGGVMVARASAARPWLFREVAQGIGLVSASQDAILPVTPQEDGRELALAYIKYVGILQKYFTNDQYVVDRVVFAAAQALPWYKFGHSFWKLTTKARSSKELVELLIDFGERFENPSVARVSHR